MRALAAPGEVGPCVDAYGAGIYRRPQLNIEV
jgi:hypothetical protein